MRRIGAILALLCIAALLLATLLAAFFGAGTQVLLALLFCDMALLICIYSYGIITKYLRNKK